MLHGAVGQSVAGVGGTVIGGQRGKISARGVNGGVSGIMVIPYVVQKGDTLASLAKKFNTTANQIKQDNARVLKGSTKLTPGMILNIAKNSKK
jgi:LysM repeat protein